MTEDASTDKGMMGYGIATALHKPSDGIPFKKYLSSVAGMTPRGPSGGAPMSGGPMAGAAFMKKKMRKK